MEDKRDTILKFFEELSFEEDSHSYFLNGLKLKTSVSKRCKNFQEKTDFYSIAKNIDIKKGLPLGTTNRFWKLKADTACAIGTETHYFAEVYTFNKNIKPVTKRQEASKNFLDSLPKHIVPVVTELKMWHKEQKYAGTLDLLLYNTTTEKFIIADYKTNSKLYDNFQGKKLQQPFDNMLDNNISLYTISLSDYQILFEQTGFEVESRVIVWIKEDGTYDLIQTEDVKNKILSTYE